MFWDKKKEEKGLPDLPPLRPVIRPAQTIQPIPAERNEFPELPEEEEKEVQELPEAPEEELPELPGSRVQKRPETSKIRELEEFEMPKERWLSEITPATKTEEVYIKIDKFHSARKSLAAAKTKLHEIEQLLGKIRETKMREEQELASWEKEIGLIKTKVEDVTKNIFEKVD